MKTVQDMSKVLAGEHGADDAGMELIYLVPHSNEVRFIEITSSVPADGEILPFRFFAGDGTFKCLVVMVNPKDWARRCQLRWPAELDPTSQQLECLFRRPASREVSGLARACGKPKQ